jgi:hypothetical protein
VFEKISRKRVKIKDTWLQVNGGKGTCQKVDGNCAAMLEGGVFKFWRTCGFQGLFQRVQPLLEAL